MNLTEKPIRELHSMLRSKKCSAREITQDALDRIDRTDSDIGAFVTVCGENALAVAEEVDAMIADGREIPMLAGIPIGLKDNICTSGIQTTCASKMLSQFVPPYNAAVVEKLIDCKAVIIGKLNMDEFAIGSSTESSYIKKTKNPRNLDCVPGGSSGGSAAAVAAGLCTAALGSDTGGSIRQPAAFCGVTGLKPTYGSVSRYGIVSFASSLDHIGIAGRTAEDTDILLAAICGRDSRDAMSENFNYTAGLTEDVQDLVIGLPKEYYGSQVSDDIKTAVMAAAKEYERAGAKLKEISLGNTQYASSVYHIITSAEASSNFAKFDGVRYGYRAEEYGSVDEMYEKSRAQGFGDEVKLRILLGTYFLGAEQYDDYYKKARLTMKLIQNDFDQAFGQCDLILTPTTTGTAFKFGQSFDPLQRFNMDMCTIPANLAGLPAISIPCGCDSDRLPIGMQLIAPAFCEKLLLNTANAYQCRMQN